MTEQQRALDQWAASVVKALCRKLLTAHVKASGKVIVRSKVTGRAWKL